MDQILLENIHTGFLLVEGGKNCPFFGQKWHFWAMKLQILKLFWPSKCIFLPIFPPYCTYMMIDMLEAPLVPLQGKLSEKMHLKGQNGFKTGIFSAQKCHFWPKKSNFYPPLTNRNTVWMFSNSIWSIGTKKYNFYA